MPVTDRDFRQVLGRFASGVTVVTTTGSGHRPYGLTATAFASVSLHPPLVLVCISRAAESFPHFEAAGTFAVNFLAAGQQQLSERFAVSGADKFAGVPWRKGVTGAPILDGVLAYVECTVEHRYGGGDHVIYVGRVEAALAREGEPLVYYSGRYRELLRG